MWFSLSFNCPFFFFLSASPMNPAKRSFDWPSANSKAASLDPNTRYLTISLSLVHHHHHRSRFILVIRSIIIYRLEGHLGTAASLRTRCSLRALTTSPCYCFNSYLHTQFAVRKSCRAKTHNLCFVTNDQRPRTIIKWRHLPRISIPSSSRDFDYLRSTLSLRHLFLNVQIAIGVRTKRMGAHLEPDPECTSQIHNILYSHTDTLHPYGLLEVMPIGHARTAPQYKGQVVEK